MTVPSATWRIAATSPMGRPSTSAKTRVVRNSSDKAARAVVSRVDPSIGRLVTLRERVGGTPLHAAQLVVAGVHRHPVQPRREQGVAAELTRLAEHGEESLLHRVQGVLPVAHDAQADREHPILVTPHELVESGSVATDGASEEIRICEVFHRVSGYRPTRLPPPLVTVARGHRQRNRSSDKEAW